MITTPFKKDSLRRSASAADSAAWYVRQAPSSLKETSIPVWDVLEDSNTKVVAQIAPAVRVAIGEYFGLEEGANSLGHLASALRFHWI